MGVCCATKLVGSTAVYSFVVSAIYFSKSRRAWNVYCVNCNRLERALFIMWLTKLPKASNTKFVVHNKSSFLYFKLYYMFRP